MAGRPTRVLWVIKGLGPGGAEHLLLDHARNSHAGSIDYQVAYLLPWKDHLAGPLSDAGVAVTCLDVRGATDVRWMWRLLRVVRSCHPDVVHVHSPALAVVCRMLLRVVRARPRLVYTDHNRWPQYRLPTRTLNALTYSLDDAHIAVSDGVLDTIWRRHREGVAVILNGIDVGAARSKDDRDAVRAELDIPRDATVVGTVANLRRAKNYPNLMRAAKRVLAQRPDVIFVAVGQGPDEGELRRLHAELGLDRSFRLLGYREDAIRVASCFDVFALASSHEGYPLAMMEAMALGLPVVATAVGGIPEAIDDGVQGRLVPPRDPGALAAGLLDVIGDDATRVRMAVAARERSERFDSRPAIERLEQLYLRLG